MSVVSGTEDLSMRAAATETSVTTNSIDAGLHSPSGHSASGLSGDSFSLTTSATLAAIIGANTHTHTHTPTASSTATNRPRIDGMHIPSHLKMSKMANGHHRQNGSISSVNSINGINSNNINNTNSNNNSHNNSRRHSKHVHSVSALSKLEKDIASKAIEASERYSPVLSQSPSPKTIHKKKIKFHAYTSKNNKNNKNNKNTNNNTTNDNTSSASNNKNSNNKKNDCVNKKNNSNNISDHGSMTLSPMMQNMGLNDLTKNEKDYLEVASRSTNLVVLSLISTIAPCLIQLTLGKDEKFLFIFWILDAFITSLSIYLSFTFSKKLYNKVCFCHYCIDPCYMHFMFDICCICTIPETCKKDNIINDTDDNNNNNTNNNSNNNNNNNNNNVNCETGNSTPVVRDASKSADYSSGGNYKVGVPKNISSTKTSTRQQIRRAKTVDDKYISKFKNGATMKAISEHNEQVNVTTKTLNEMIDDNYNYVYNRNKPISTMKNNNNNNNNDSENDTGNETGNDTGTEHGYGPSLDSPVSSLRENTLSLVTLTPEENTIVKKQNNYALYD